MNWLDNFLWFSTGLVWSAILIWTVIAIKDWFKKVNRYDDRIFNQYSSIVNVENEMKGRIGSLKQNNTDQIKQLTDRLEKLEGKKRK